MIQYLSSTSTLSVKIVFLWKTCKGGIGMLKTIVQRDIILLDLMIFAFIVIDVRLFEIVSIFL